MMEAKDNQKNRIVLSIATKDAAACLCHFPPWQMLGDGPEEPGENVRIDGVNDYPERGLHQQGLGSPRQVGVDK